MKKLFILLIILVNTNLVFPQTVPISQLRNNDSNGIPLDTGKVFTVTGIITCSDQFGSPSSIQDGTAGISVFGTSFTNQVNLGDSVTLTSVLSQFNGLTEFDFRSAGSSVNVHSNTKVPEPTILTINDITSQEWNGFEAYEGLLIRINNVTINASGNFASGTNYNITDTTGTLAAGLRIDNNVSTIIGTPIPSVQIDIIGILGQYNNPPYVPPFNNGYQLQPRFILDLVYESNPIILSPVTAAEIDTSSFTVYFNTAHKGNSQIKYGLTPSLELDSVIIDEDTTFHKIKMTGLHPLTLYYFKAYSTNSIGTSESDLKSVSTASNDTSIGKINIYFNYPVDTTIAIPENNANGDVNFPQKLIERINNVTYSIDLALYSFSDMPQVADALVLAKNRGVRVRVVYDHRGGNPLQNSMQTLSNAGILISRRPNETSTFHGIMHNKFFIFDARDTIPNNDWLWTGSWNVTNLETGWKNNVIEINDPTITYAYQVEFEEMWGSSTDIPNPSNAKFGYFKTDNTPHSFVIGGRQVKVYFSPSDGTTSQIINAVQSMNYSMYFAIYTFTRSEINNAMLNMYNGGVTDIRGIIDQTGDPNSQWNNLNTYAEMFSNPGATLHHKYALFDPQYSASNPTVLTGSHNWSSAAENDNDENTLIIYDSLIANQYLQEFKKRYNEAGGTGTFVIPVSVNDPYAKDFSYKLYQNYPNPFNPITNINFSVPQQSKVELNVYNTLGELITTLVNEEKEAGSYKVLFNASNLPSGVYFYRISAGEFNQTKKFILLK